MNPLSSNPEITALAIGTQSYSLSQKQVSGNKKIKKEEIGEILFTKRLKVHSANVLSTLLEFNVGIVNSKYILQNKYKHVPF